MKINLGPLLESLAVGIVNRAVLHRRGVELVPYDESREAPAIRVVPAPNMQYSPETGVTAAPGMQPQAKTAYVVQTRRA